MRLRSFEIKSLFGTFDYKFEIDTEQTIFLLTGPNGYGKTTILKIISELVSGNFYYFYSLPFDIVDLRFDSGDQVVITSKKDVSQSETIDTGLNPDKIVTFEWKHNGETASMFELSTKSLKEMLHNARPGSMMWELRRRPTSIDIGSKQFSLWMNENIVSQKFLAEAQDAGAFLLFLQGMAVNMLQTDRLKSQVKDGKSEKESIATVSQVSDKLKEQLCDLYFKYLQNTNRTNSSLFDKLLDNTVKPLSSAEYAEKTYALSPKLSQLHEWGLCNENTIRPYDSSHTDILSVYIREMEINLAVYEDIYAKLLLFKEMLEAKRFINKNISFNPVRGIEVRYVTGELLDLDLLSSGEQQEIIMLYYAIFGVRRNSLLLIDEPENSLHVAWQNHYLDELERIADKQNLQVLVATHSPQIIGGRWDECYDLFEAVNNG